MNEYISVSGLAGQSLLQNSASQHPSASQALTNHLAAVAPSLLAGAQSQLLAGLGQQVCVGTISVKGMVQYCCNYMILYYKLQCFAPSACFY